MNHAVMAPASWHGQGLPLAVLLGACVRACAPFPLGCIYSYGIYSYGRAFFFGLAARLVLLGTFGRSGLGELGSDLPVPSSFGPK